MEYQTQGRCARPDHLAPLRRLERSEFSDFSENSALSDFQHRLTVRRRMTMSKRKTTVNPDAAANLAATMPSHLNVGLFKAETSDREAVEASVRAMRDAEPEMLTRFKAFKASGPEQRELATWIYWFTRRQVFRDSGIKTLADYLRDKLAIPADDKTSLKSARNAWDYLRSTVAGEVESEKAAGTGKSIYELVSAYLNKRFSQLSLDEQFRIVDTLSTRYEVARDVAAKQEQKAA